MSGTRHNDPIFQARGKLANHTRQGAPQPVLDDLRRELAEAKLERHIREAIDAAPPLTQDQRDRLARILAGGAR